ncbi:MAG: hypothetical protein HDR00_12865 [Lachnospiraceae bacterium]|nr:hypothetical protein [Lachnospiraceae bacterium]
MFWGIVVIAVMILYFTYLIINRKKIREKIDGVETIDGIKYLINNTDVQYIMYKLGSTIISKNIKETSFEKISDSEGILTFGGVAYNLNMTGSESDMNIGAAYRIKCKQQGSDVLMEIFFEKEDIKFWLPSSWLPDSRPGLELNQAYHRFFKEVFDVKVVT